MSSVQVGPVFTVRDLRFPAFQVGLAVAVLIAAVLAGRSAITAAEAAPPPDTWQRRGAAAAEVARSRPGTVAFAVVDSNGQPVASHKADNPVPAASTIKALILAAYLRQPDVADRELTSNEAASLERMITASSNSDASSLLASTGWEAVERVADQAGMGDAFVPDYDSWGLSQITAGGMAAFFHSLPSMLPPAHRDFALALFAEVIPSQRWGMAAAAPDGWAWHIKGGWIDEAVNQIGTFTKDGQEFTVAVLVEAGPGTGSGVSGEAPEQVPAVESIGLVASALFGDGTLPATAAAAAPCEPIDQLPASLIRPGWACSGDLRPRHSALDADTDAS